MPLDLSSSTCCGCDPDGFWCVKAQVECRSVRGFCQACPCPPNSGSPCLDSLSSSQGSALSRRCRREEGPAAWPQLPREPCRGPRQWLGTIRGRHSTGFATKFARRSHTSIPGLGDLRLELVHGGRATPARRPVFYGRRVLPAGNGTAARPGNWSEPGAVLVIRNSRSMRVTETVWAKTTVSPIP